MAKTHSNTSFLVFLEKLRSFLTSWLPETPFFAMFCLIFIVFSVWGSSAGSLKNDEKAKSQTILMGGVKSLVASLMEDLVSKNPAK